MDFVESPDLKDLSRRNTIRVVAFGRLVATGIATIIFAVVVLFLYNPTERTYSEMNKMTEAKADPAHVEPTKEAISQQNKEVVTKKSNEMRRDATEDNTNAMDAFKKLTEQTTN